MTPSRERTARRPSSKPRLAALALVLLWGALLARRTMLNERQHGASTADPYSDPRAIIGLPPGDDQVRQELVPALRRLADDAGDRHEAGAPALVLLPPADSTSVTFVLYQLAHLWYPQLVEVRAGAGTPQQAATRRGPAFVYVHQRADAGDASAAPAPGDSVAAVPGFVAFRVGR